MQPLTFIESAVKAISRRLTFLPTRYSNGIGYGWSGSHTAGDLSLRHATLQSGATLDYEVAAGDVLSNSVVAACVNAITQALPEAPILLEHRVGANEFERIESHPVLDLLHNPNPYLSEAELWGVTTAYERTRGEAFWYFEYDTNRTFPREIWFRAPEYVQVLSDEQRFIAGYNITSESGKVVSLDESDVVHFRHQLSVTNPRAGWSPIATGKRQIVGDNGAATYHSAILRNAGATSLIISLKDAAATGEVTPGQLDEYVQKFRRKVAGEGSGAILGMDLPLDVHKVGYSPEELTLDKLLDYYESRICALMGVNRRVINLGSDPTYENSRVALNDFWERTIVPMRRRHASTLSSQLLQLFGLDPALYRLRFDFSEVEALQENVDALHKRWRETLLAGGIDLFTFQEKIGLVPDESLRGRFVKPSAALEERSDEIKYNPNQLRDRFGRWTDGGGFFAPDDGITNIGGSNNQSPSLFWGGENRDEVTKKHFNGKFEVDIPDNDKIAVARHSLMMFKRELAPHEWGELIGSPDGEKLECRSLPLAVVVRKTSESDSSSLFVSLIREIRHGGEFGRDEEKQVHLYAAAISRKAGTVEGMAPRMVFYSAKKCHKLGIKYLVSQAEGNKHTTRTSIGYRYWPKLGFNADITPADRAKLAPKHKSAKTVLDLYEIEDGERAWREIGGKRKMYFDTTPESRSQQILASYLRERGIKP
jgi:HK97 family phage portal protein